MTASATLWRPDVVARVQALQLRARQTVAGLGVGLRRSIHVGQAVEFADYKPYTPGDNLRDLDWRVLGRRDRLVVRRYRAETEMGATLLVDASGDLGSTPEKWDLAVGLAATIAWLLFQENEPVGIELVGGEGVAVRSLPPRRGRGHLARIFGLLATLRPSGRAGLAQAFARVGARARPRGLVVLITDFMEPPASWAPALDAVIRRRADLRALHIYDARETGLAYPHPLRLYSLEGGDDELLDPEAMREAVSGEATRFFGEVRDEVRRRRGVHVLVEARGSMVEAMGSFLLGREGGVP